MSQNMAMLEQSAMEVWGARTLDTSFLCGQQWYSQSHDQLCSLFFCPVTLQSFILAAFCQISLDRRYLLRDKNEDEKEKRCFYSG